MESQIKEDKVLEFKALVATKRVFDQMRQVNPGEVEGSGTYEAKFIGWVKDGPAEYFIGEAHGTLVKVSRIDMWEWIAGVLGYEKLAEEAMRLNIGRSQLVNSKLDEYRDSLSQIFLR